jgi:hypothetical protein
MHLVDDGKKDSRVQGVQGSSEILIMRLGLRPTVAVARLVSVFVQRVTARRTENGRLKTKRAAQPDNVRL